MFWLSKSSASRNSDEMANIRRGGIPRTTRQQARVPDSHAGRGDRLGVDVEAYLQWLRVSGQLRFTPEGSGSSLRLDVRAKRPIKYS